MMVFGPPVAPYKAASAGADRRCGHKTCEDQKLLFKGLFQELGYFLHIVLLCISVIGFLPTPV